MLEPKKLLKKKKNNGNKLTKVDTDIDKFSKILLKYTDDLNKNLNENKNEKREDVNNKIICLNSEIKISHINNYSKLTFNYDVEKNKHKKVFYIATVGNLEYVNEYTMTNINVGENIFIYDIDDIDKCIYLNGDIESFYKCIFMIPIFREELKYDIKALLGKKLLLRYLHFNSHNYSNLFVSNNETSVDTIILWINELIDKKDFNVDSEEYQNKKINELINLHLSYFDKFYLYEKEHVINYLNEKTIINNLKCQFIFNINNVFRKHKKIIILKLTKNLKNHQKRYTDTLLKSNSLLFNYLKNVCDNNLGCIKCQKPKYYFEYCIFCCDNLEKYIDNILCTVKKLFDCKHENLKNEIIILEEIYSTQYYELNQFLQDYNKNSFDVTRENKFNCIQREHKIKNIDLNIFLNDSMSDIEKANFFITNKYYELFDTPNNFNYNCDDFKYTPEKYINSIIKKLHLKTIVFFIKNIIQCIKYNRINNLSKIKICSNRIEIRFLYAILDNKHLIKHIKQIIIEPIIIQKKRYDCFLLLKIKNVNVPVYIEFDDFQNNELLIGGHNEVRRKASDIIKDVYCWFFGLSLIRVKYDENIIELLNNMINNNNVFPYYRFYDKYFNKKMQLI